MIQATSILPTPLSLRPEPKRAGSTKRERVQRPRRLVLRHLRRVLLPQTTRSSRQRGNTSVGEALYAASPCEKSTIVHCGRRSLVEPILQDSLFTVLKIAAVWNRFVNRILRARKAVTDVRIRCAERSATRELSTHGVFVAIVNDPVTSLVRGQIVLGERSYTRRVPWSAATASRTSGPLTIVPTLSFDRPFFLPAWGIWRHSKRRNG